MNLLKGKSKPKELKTSTENSTSSENLTKELSENLVEELKAQALRSEEKIKQTQESELEVLKKELHWKTLREQFDNEAEFRLRLILVLQEISEQLSSIGQQMYDLNQLVAKSEGLEVEEE